MADEMATHLWVDEQVKALPVDYRSAVPSMEAADSDSRAAALRAILPQAQRAIAQRAERAGAERVRQMRDALPVMASRGRILHEMERAERGERGPVVETLPPMPPGVKDDATFARDNPPVDLEPLKAAKLSAADYSPF